MDTIQNIKSYQEYEKYEFARKICATGTCGVLTECDHPIISGSTFSAEVIPPKLNLPYMAKDTTITVKENSVEPILHPMDSPFDVIDENMTDMEKVKKLITYIRTESKIQFAKELADRLIFLFEAIEEDPDEDPISPESVYYLIDFLKNTPDLARPDLVLTPTNEIRAQWRKANNRHFAVVFLPTGDARFVIFAPNAIDPERVDRLSGLTHVYSLAETIKSHNVFGWASR